MLRRLTDAESIKDAERRISELIDAHGEWFYAERAGAAPSNLRRSECDVRVSHGRLIFSCWSDKGARSWRILGWTWTGDRLLLQAARRMGTEQALLELIPRAQASDIAAIITGSRRALGQHLARLASEELHAAKIERLSLSAGAHTGQPGRYARIILRSHQDRIALTGPVVQNESNDVDAFLSSALVWFKQVRQRTERPHIQSLWLVVQPLCTIAALRQVALLRDELQCIIKLYEVDNEWREMKPVPLLERAELWTEDLSPLPMMREKSLSETARRIIELEPRAIDVVHAHHGETLRFHGLPFARVRHVMNRERVWFGIEGKRRRLLDQNTEPEWTSLIEELQEHRRSDAQDHRHMFYKALPEAWLESLLRRDITRLDPGLIIAPLHAQFRTAHPGQSGSRPVDLLALRADGRLVVIEVKASADREHVLQAADYWRRVEAHRRRGHIARARLFGDAFIEDSPALVYLVAPLLRFHRDFHTLAQSITPEIELYRFDIAENWRSAVHTIRRSRVN